MRVLIGSVVHQRPDVFAAFLAGLVGQESGADTEILLLMDMTDPNATRNAATANGLATVWHAGPKPDGAVYAVDERSHDWRVPTFYWLAEQKQRILDHAAQNGFDAVWLVDSDLICDPLTLHSLLSTRKDVVSAVFWTQWTPEAPPLPQVWRAHPYEFHGAGWEAHEFVGSIVNRQLTPVAGLGACTLIHADVLDRVGFWPLVPGLPNWGMWQGEDRHFCVRAQRNHVQLWADPWPDVWHCYRPSDDASIPYYAAALAREDPPRRPGFGDRVWFTVEPLEEPRLGVAHAEHVRGRWGQLSIVPSLEKIVSGLRSGEERIAAIRFPYWHDLPDYRDREKLVRVRMIDVRKHAPPPGLGESDNVESILGPFIQHVS